MELEFTTSAEFMLKDTYDYFKDWIDAESHGWIDLDKAVKVYKLAEEAKRLFSVLWERCETENEKRIADYFYEEICYWVASSKKTLDEKVRGYSI